jgi:phospholipid/cholesterol/gamma-HCH transport system permease protein
VLPFIENRLKSATLEVQEYVRLVVAAFHAMFTRPRYGHDIVEQFDKIGVGSLTVVILTGFFTGAALCSQSGLTQDAFGARPIVCLLNTYPSPRDA